MAKARRRYSTEQIVAALKQAELGLPVADLIRQMGITEQTYYRWKKKCAGLESDQVRELKQLADENTRLKKLVAELSLLESRPHMAHKGQTPREFANLSSRCHRDDREMAAAN